MECCQLALNGNSVFAFREIAPIGTMFCCPTCHGQWILSARDKKGTLWDPASVLQVPASADRLASNGGTAGRQKTAGVDKAVQLRTKGRRWPSIYPTCIPDYKTMSQVERQQKTRNLREAVYAREKRDLPQAYSAD